MNKWSKKNAAWMLLYVVLYVVMSVIVCILGSVHPFLFVCYQVFAGLLLTGVTATSFDRIKAPGAAACLLYWMIRSLRQERKRLEMLSRMKKFQIA